MNRLIICTILLLGSTSAFAEKLYRWIEADGSITFSPNPPPKGVEFKTIQSDGNASAAPKIESADTQKSILATSEHNGTTLPKIRVNETKVSTRAPAAVQKQQLNYAPETGSGITVAQRAQTDEPKLQKNTGAMNANTVASNKKRQQCQDLSKRVISLERRLRSKLTADDMDNTVIAMARYQRSYDQHCVN